MKQHTRCLATWVMAATLVGAAPAAWAQSPTATPAAKKPDAKKPDAKKPDARKPDAKGDGAKPGGAGDAGLPAGHPPVEGDGDAMPPGHPPTGGGDPHGGGAAAGDPHGGGAGAQGLYRAPEDEVETDPALPVGSVVVTVKDASDQPVPGAQLILGILHNTVAKGESSERVTRTTDGQGAVRFDGLQVGGGVSYLASVESGPAIFEAPPFSLDDKSGKRASLHTFEVVEGETRELRTGMWGVVFLSLREDVISVEQHMTVLNVDPVAWVPQKTTIGLPEDYKGYVKPDGMGAAVRWEEVDGEGASLRGTVTPGQHETGFRYQVPLAGDDKQTIKIELPTKTFQMAVMAEASKTMNLQVSGFPAAQRTERNGKKVMVTKRQVDDAGEELGTVEITLSGLPVPGIGRWVAVGLGLSLAGAGVWALLRRREDGAMPDDVRQELEEAKQTLLDEIVSLERAHHKGDVGPKTYARVRAALLDALARIVTRLDAARPISRKAHAYR
ncbi:MAG: carboxypeptidase-like regulatory domain-containing protein [Polyangiaceae bacterium]